MSINFPNIQSLYNKQMDILLSSAGLATEVILNYNSKNNICPNCIYDPSLKKSANKYKTGGPVPFAAGRICPYCNGLGLYGETETEKIHLAIIWDYKQWINPPVNSVAIADGMIQTICNHNLLSSLRSCRDIDVVYPSSSNNYQRFQLYGEPKPAGLGDNNYIICIWKKIN